MAVLYRKLHYNVACYNEVELYVYPVSVLDHSKHLHFYLVHVINLSFKIWLRLRVI